LGYHYGEFLGYGRNSRQMSRTAYDTVMVSGGFDPIHIGHVRMIQEAAREFGDVIVAVNSDDWLLRKKGYVFMPWEERAEIVRAIDGVTKVVAFDDADNTACDAIRKYKPTFFANGGDRTTENTPEQFACEELGVRMVWSIGGGKIQSSSDLVNGSAEHLRIEAADWPHGV
jgi:D-beta-D-heptose 7-phosphate kinase/D-beta-D-heptose 1-phosphate adenosyltransferase